MCRILGMVSKLQDLWDVPYVVVEKMSAVNYRIEEVDGRKKCKTVHVNNLKSYKERDLEVCTLTVVAEENEEEKKGIHYMNE